MQNICFTFAQGNHLALMGPAASGGKTLLAKCPIGNVFLMEWYHLLRMELFQNQNYFVPAVQRLKTFPIHPNCITSKDLTALMPKTRLR